MSAPAAEARGLGKRYWTGGRAERTLLGRAKAGLGLGPGLSARWALRGVDAAVAPGEALAVVGPNAAGKSTFLALLAGIARPDEGGVRVRGRVGAFLSPGAGLYPELGVLDNIRLTASLYGLSSRGLAAELDAIVEFGGLEPYLGARLGELSAGYQARLVFSTALHAPLDLLLFDEVFSVGDAAFAARCLKRLDAARAAGAAVVLATHDLDLAAERCGRALYLESGRAAASGPCAEALSRYRAAMAA